MGTRVSLAFILATALSLTGLPAFTDTTKPPTSCPETDSRGTGSHTPCSPSAPEKQPGKPRKTILQLILQDKSLGQTLRGLNQTIKAAPDDLGNYFLRGMLFREMGLSSLADADIQSLRELIAHPKDETGFLLRGTQRNAAGEYALARADFDEVIRRNPKLAEAYLGRAGALGGLELYDLALKDLDQAIALNSKLQQAYHFKGILLFHMNEYERATDALTKAIELNPEDTEAWFHRGGAWALLHNWDAALNDYSHVLELNPDHLKAYSVRVKVYEALHQYPLAIKDYTHLLRLEPENMEHLIARGRAYWEDQQLDRALADAETVLARDPDSLDALSLMENVYYCSNQPDKAIAFANKMIRLKPEKPWLYYFRGRSYRLKNQFDQALADFNKAIDLGFDYGYEPRAYLHALRGNWDEADRDMKTMFTLHPDLILFQESQGWLEFLKGEPEKARGIFQKVYPELLKTNIKTWPFWLELELPRLLKNFPGIETSPHLKNIRQDLALARKQGDGQAMIRVYEGMVQMLEDWQAKNGHAVQSQR